MAMRPLRPCLHTGCPELVSSGRCDKHKVDHRECDRHRGSSTERGYGARWQRYRLQFLRANPLCVDCLPDRITPAKEVHHIVAKRDGGKDDYDNLMSLCRPCHSRRTSKGE